MPRGDRTGPRGLGPMTGRAAGYCAGYPVPGFMNPIPGYGRGFGRGFGRGYGRGWRGYQPQYPYVYAPQQYPPQQYAYPQQMYPPAPPQSPEGELAAIKEYKKGLEAEKADLERETSEIEARIKELKMKIEQGREQPPGP